MSDVLEPSAPAAGRPGVRLAQDEAHRGERILTSGSMSIRFDSWGGRGLRFARPVSVLEAWESGEVVELLRQVEGAVRAGRHAAGFVAYEAAPAFEPALPRLQSDPELPLACFGIFEGYSDVEPPPDGELATPKLGAWSASVSYEEYSAAVERVRDLIAAGDTYQVNFTFRLDASFEGDPAALYHRLRRAQRADFSALIQRPGYSIASASPELFFRRTGDLLEMRPMKGTRPRGRWVAEDRRRAEELVSSEKDRAENLMIVDLLRNDLGRVAEFGSVEVARLFELERYPTVHQLTSTVRARVREETGLAEVFRALFPSGSVTGAPKVRTMEIIRELEGAPRGVYTGAIGFVSPGEAVFSVPIRTLVVKEWEGTARLGVGSGITYDSDARSEYAECMQKAEFARRAREEVELLETMLWTPGEGVRLLEDHLERLSGSAEYFEYAVDLRRIRKVLAEATRAMAQPTRLRLRVSADGTPRVETAPHRPAKEPVRVAIAREAVDSADPLLYHKTTRREMYDERRAAHPDYEDVILRNERGELTELTVGNLVARIGGRDFTPPVSCGLLPGTLRGLLLREGALRERVLMPEDLATADAVFRINSVQGWQRLEVDPCVR